MKFSIGQRVIAVTEADRNSSIIGKVGTVQDFINNYRNSETWWGVEFEEYVDGHSLGNNREYYCEHGYGWYCSPDSLKLLDQIVELEDMI